MEGIESTVSLDWGEIVRPLQASSPERQHYPLRPKSLFGATDGKTFRTPPHDVLRLGGILPPDRCID